MHHWTIKRQQRYLQQLVNEKLLSRLDGGWDNCRHSKEDGLWGLETELLSRFHVFNKFVGFKNEY